MIRTVLKGFTAIILALAIVIMWAITINKPTQASFNHYSLPKEFTTLQQNWTSDIRQQVNHTSVGSLLMPLAWFLNLDRPDASGLFSDAQHLSTFGFIPQAYATNNTYGLPVGFSLDTKNNEPWIGLTCAACHSSLIEYGTHQIFIDGGAGQINFSVFESTLFDAVTQTLHSPSNFQKFALALRTRSPDELKSQLTQWRDKFKKRLIVNKTDTPYGHGRLDAFGIIFNAISVNALGIPTNIRPPDAPTSIPVLWDAGHLDAVQWNGSAPNQEPGPLGQNVPTSLAVYGEIKMSENSVGGYSSSVRIKNLGYLQKNYYNLTSPKWPKEILGELNDDKMSNGEKLYLAHCQRCHLVADNPKSKRQYRSTLVDISEVGTDPAMATNFVERRVDSGFLQGKKQFIIAGKRLENEVQPISLVINASIGTMLKKPFNTLSAIATEFAVNLPQPQLNNQKVYKARQLNGIWTSAPYLHNGSVPTLWDLLAPEENRPSVFFTGNRQLDTVKVGFRIDKTENYAIFDTAQYGNSNAGHTYGTSLKADEKWALIEYLKSL